MNIFELSSDVKYLKISKDELSIIASTLVEFDQEMHWAVKRSTNKDIFTEEFNKKFSFSLNDLEFVEDALSELHWNLRDVSITEIGIYFSTKNIPKKSMIIYTALNECSKNYEDYEISTRTGISKKELDTVLKEFKEKVQNTTA